MQTSWVRCSSAHPTAEEFVGLAGLDWPGVAGKAAGPPLEYRQRAGDQWRGCIVESLCQCEQEAFKACGRAGALVSVWRGLREGYFQAEAMRSKSTHVLGLRLLRLCATCPHGHSASFQPPPAVFLQLPLLRQRYHCAHCRGGEKEFSCLSRSTYMLKGTF